MQYVSKAPPKPIRNAPMTRVPPPAAAKAPVPLSKADNKEAMIEVLRNRVNDLEARLATLESMISVQGTNVVINAPGNVILQAGGSVELGGSTIRTSSALVENSTGMFKCSGVVNCDTLIAKAVVASSYTPGAGNIW